MTILQANTNRLVPSQGCGTSYRSGPPCESSPVVFTEGMTDLCAEITLSFDHRTALTELWWIAGPPRTTESLSVL